MLISLFKTVLIFSKTFYYFLLSYKKNSDILFLKKKWANSVLNDFGFDLDVVSQSVQYSKVIFVGNHISFLDIVVLIAAEPRIIFLSKSEVSRWPIIGHAAKRIGSVFVKRDCVVSRAEAKIEIANIIKQAQGICIAGFPSGTTSLYEEKSWKKGLFDIAQQAGISIQPFRLQYSPARESAYIDQDNLLLTMVRLFRIENKKVILEWGQVQQVLDPIGQSETIRLWTQNHNKIKYETTKFFRSAHTFELQ